MTDSVTVYVIIRQCKLKSLFYKILFSLSICLYFEGSVTEGSGEFVWKQTPVRLINKKEHDVQTSITVVLFFYLLIYLVNCYLISLIFFISLFLLLSTKSLKLSPKLYPITWSPKLLSPKLYIYMYCLRGG